MTNDSLPAHIQFDKLREIFTAVAKRRVRNERDAEEIVQDTLVTVLEKAAAQTFEKGFLQWAFGVLRNKIGNHYQKQGRQAGHSREVTEDDLRLCPDPGIGPHEALEEADLRDRIGRAWRGLNPECQQLLWMLYRGCPREEIFRAFPRFHFKVVNTKIFRCRNYLRRLLRKEGYPR